jgi:MFS family permease
MHGLYLLWWVQEKQMSPAVVAAVLAAGDLALMVLELPTGWLADRFGHRISLALGSLVQVAGMLWCWLGEGVPSLVIASVLVALGDAFRSGADQALLYRTCVALDREDAFQTIEARTSAVELAALVGLVLAGGVIVERWGFAAGWLAETVLCVLGFVLACAMVEPPPAVSDTTGVSDTTPGSDLAGRSDPMTMFLIIMPASLLTAAAGAASFLAQTAGTSDPERMTALVAMITFAEAAGSAAAARINLSGWRMHAGLLVLGALFIGGVFLFPPTFYAVLLALSFLAGVVDPLRATAIQRMAADDVRARAASMASVCDMALSTVTLPLAGWWSAR